MAHGIVPDAVRRLAQDHVDMRLALSALEREVDAVAQYREANSDVLGGGVQYFANFARSCHHPIEEAILAALRLRAPEAALRASCLAQHETIVERIGEFATVMRNLSLDAPKWRVTFCTMARGFITLTRDHIREEERLFFPLALDHLTAEDWATIGRTSQEAQSAWMSDPANAAAVLAFRAERAARASGSALQP